MKTVEPVWKLIIYGYFWANKINLLFHFHFFFIVLSSYDISLVEENIRMP